MKYLSLTIGFILLPFYLVALGTLVGMSLLFNFSQETLSRLLTRYFFFEPQEWR